MIPGLVLKEGEEGGRRGGKVGRREEPRKQGGREGEEGGGSVLSLGPSTPEMNTRISLGMSTVGIPPHLHGLSTRTGNDMEDLGDVCFEK